MPIFSRGNRGTSGAGGAGHSYHQPHHQSPSFFHSPHHANSNRRTPAHRMNLTGRPMAASSIHNHGSITNASSSSAAAAAAGGGGRRSLGALGCVALIAAGTVLAYVSVAGYSLRIIMYRQAAEEERYSKSAIDRSSQATTTKQQQQQQQQQAIAVPPLMHVRSTKAEPAAAAAILLAASSQDDEREEKDSQKHTTNQKKLANDAKERKTDRDLDDDVERLSETIEDSTKQRIPTDSEGEGEAGAENDNLRKVQAGPPDHQQPQRKSSNKRDHIPPQLRLQTEPDFAAHRAAVQAALQEDPSILPLVRRVISAWVEPPWNDTVPGTGDRGDLSSTTAARDWGTPPDFVAPLPLRTHTPGALRELHYPRVQTCRDLPGRFPVDRGLQLDENGAAAVVGNVGGDPTPPDFAQQEAPFCPVELDPFLPWIHDVFPSQDGARIEFVAQNKRRCRTGVRDSENVNRLVPQVALLQAVSVARLSDRAARQLAPELWHPSSSGPDSDNNNNDGDGDDEDDSDNSDIHNATRYRLVPIEEAAPDGRYTRFVCRFHATTIHNGLPHQVPLGETLSEYPFNYELVSYRKGQKSLLSPKGKDTTLFWASNLHFSCPLPPGNAALRQAVATGATLLDDGTPTLRVDVAPIRTSARYAELHLGEELIGPRREWELPAFDAAARWGSRGVLPRWEASGRWTNLPVCRPPELTDLTTTETAMDLDTFETTQVTRKLVPDIWERTRETKSKPHFLSACLWASAEYRTRGENKAPITDTPDRLKEWIEFHLMVGFDHFYVYDNSGAHTNAATLEPVLALFPGRVTRIDWPSAVCNNNIPAHDSTGERSSQYAAENSCRIRYGPFSEWMAAFDTDEYFVPMGNYTNLKDMLKDAEKGGTNILSLLSSRGKLRVDKSVEVGDSKNAIEKAADATFLEAYNCDSGGSPKPSWAERARKHIYKTDYVLYHYVHYATVTQGLIETYEEAQKANRPWKRHFGEQPPSERNADEFTEVVMVHAKTTESITTKGYKTRCKFDYEKKWQGCYVAVPWPSNFTSNKLAEKDAHDENGMQYNCWINKRVDDYFVPKLKDALAKRKS